MLKFILVAFLFAGYVSVKIYKTYFVTVSAYIVVPTFFILIQSVVIIKILDRTYPTLNIPDIFTTLSYIILALSIIFFVYFILFDILSLIKVTKFLPFDKKYLILVLAVGTFIYGYYHQLNAFITEYDIVTTKSLNKDVKIVFISDIHIDSATNDKKLQAKMDTINKLAPDIVLIGGDLIDTNINHLTAERKNILASLEAPTYAVLGNHEYYSGTIPDVVKNIEEADITLLQDDVVKLDNLSLTLIGRDTRSHNIETSTVIYNRKSVAKLAQGIDNNTVSIVIDHIPENDEIDRMKEELIDINLSGHTHDGQFFPVNLIVHNMYRNGYGLKIYDGLNHIVSSGMGLWGPPIRIGTKAEIVVLNIKN